MNVLIKYYSSKDDDGYPSLSVKKIYGVKIDPLQIDEEEDLYAIQYTTIDELLSCSHNPYELTNPKIYFGERHLYDPLKTEGQKLTQSSSPMSIPQTPTDRSVILCNNGLIVTDIKPGDLTMHEYEHTNLLIELPSFFFAISYILSVLEKDEYTFKSYANLASFPNPTNNNTIATSLSTTYKIELNSAQIASYTTSYKWYQNEIPFHLLNKNPDYEAFGNLEPTLNQLYSKFQGLEPLMPSLKELAKRYHGIIPIHLVVELLINYIPKNAKEEPNSYLKLIPLYPNKQ